MMEGRQLLSGDLLSGLTTGVAPQTREHILLARAGETDPPLGVVVGGLSDRSDDPAATEGVYDISEKEAIPAG
jgi:translation elongation factor EF-Tu-like GTPase